MKKIAFLVQLPTKVSPGQRFRIEQYWPYLKSNCFQFDTFSFLNEGTYRILYKPGYITQKVLGVLKGFINRIFFLFKAKKYDYIFLQREASPIGPPIFEWILIKLLKRKIILDFDDAIWIPDLSRNNHFSRILKCYWKVKYICRWAYRISVGNQYLAEYASRYNSSVTIIPSCVDTENRFNLIATQEVETLVIGWTGSHSTIKYLDLIFPILKKLESEFNFIFLVICNRRPEFKLQSMCFLPWNEETEINDLLKVNIGIMPLIEDSWSEGKCGFKIIQYQALGIPAVASPVGVNKKIINDAENGFLCKEDEDWYRCLRSLLENQSLREQMGRIGREKIIKEYSIQANSDLFLSLFR